MSRSFLNSPACRASTKQSTKSINKIYRVTTSKRKPFGLHRCNGFSLHRIFERNAQHVRFLADLWRNGGKRRGALQRRHRGLIQRRRAGTYHHVMILEFTRRGERQLEHDPPPSPWSLGVRRSSS